MIASSSLMYMILAVGCLVLNFFAFRGNAAAAQHGRPQMLRMAAVWVTIIVALTLLIRAFAP